MTGTESEHGAVGVILGSAFDHRSLGHLHLETRDIATPWGPWRLFQAGTAAHPAWISFRHESPHRLLPNQIPYRAQAWAFRHVGCGALLVTSSVGVLDRTVPLGRALVIRDLITLDNRLPDGSACTMFREPEPDQGHLVLVEGLFSDALSRQVIELARTAGVHAADGCVFGYVGGPRTKTAAENRMWAALGAQVNSMTVGPEVVLANELGIPCAAVVTGHKYSTADDAVAEDGPAMTRTLTDSRADLAAVVEAFLRKGRPVPFGNHLYRYRDHAQTLATPARPGDDD